MINLVTKNPINIYSAQKNLLIHYIYTNLDKAQELGDRLMKDSEEMYPFQTKDLNFLLGVISLIINKLISIEYSFIERGISNSEELIQKLHQNES